MSNETIIEGADDSVAMVVFVLLGFVAFILKNAWDNRETLAQTIDPAQLPLVARLRATFASSSDGAQTGDATTAPPAQPPRNYNMDRCPVCLANARFAVTTNCGHTYCTSCIIGFWHHSANVLAPVTCPVCRGVVNLLMTHFAEADPNEPGRQQAIDSVNDYNRRFSGQPRSILDLIRDLPVIIPYLFSRLFTAQGFIWMFQARVALCFIGLALYVLSPFDIIPEAIFGVFGLFDDLLVAFGLLLYATVIYRNFVANQ